MRYWTHMKNNDIHLSDYIVSKVNKNRIVTCNQVSYGDKVKPMKKRSMSNGSLLCGIKLTYQEWLVNMY